jgi:hypothetical protein
MNMKQIYYTGVGSRQTPTNILKLMGKIARRLSDMGLTLRTGNALGADRAFRNACCNQDVYTAKDILDPRNSLVTPECATQALEIAERIHPAWDRMSEYAQALHARNCFQVLGGDLLTPSEFLICWTPFRTPDYEPVGGTRTAIKVAEENNIPVFNLNHPNGLKDLTDYVKQQTWYAPKDQ